MKQLFIFFLTITLIFHCYRSGKEEYRKYQLNDFYSKELAFLYSRPPNALAIERLENQMIDDGFNWHEISQLKGQELRKAVYQGERSRFDLNTLRLYLDQKELKPLMHPFYLEKLHKEFRSIFKEGYTEQETEQLIKQALAEARSERFTTFDTPVEISDEPNWSFLVPHPN